MEIDKRALREEVSHRIEDNRDDLVRITQGLVRIPSVNPPGDYERMAQKMVELYKAEGLEPIVAGAPEEEVKALGLTYPRPNVIARFEGKQHSPVFCLDAHMDVVGVGDESMWKYPPFGGEIHDGKIYGRGAEDTKCHLAAQLIVLRAIKAAGIELKGDLILTSTVDDEIGQWPGMGYLIEKGFQEHGFNKPDYHIAGEPTGLETVGCLARGRLWYEIIFKGISAHGGNPKEGVNAIEKAISLANAVMSYEIKTDPLMGSDTINIGILQGGEAINVVPGQCKITFDIRPATKKEVVKQFMDETLQTLKDKDPNFKIESIRLLNDRQTGGIGPDHEFVKTVQKVVEQMTEKKATPSGNMAGYSSLGNAYWTSMNGIAGLMYGGGDFIRAHSVDEFITVDELVETAKVFAGLVVELCA
ncbi:MAG: M20 family metallopeptidase [Phycisphaerales bacterium]|jgi:succinyl-diaminopimelate desuccinylase